MTLKNHTIKTPKWNKKIKNCSIFYVFPIPYTNLCIYSKNNDLRLKRSVEDRPLFSYLFDDNVTQEKEIGLIIDKFVVD